MARNGSGSFSVVNTFVDGTTISTSEVNQNFDDIGDEITNSLALDGQSSMTGQVKAAAGAAATPGYSWANETNSGWYRAGAGDFRYAIGGTDVFKITSAGATVFGALTATITGYLASANNLSDLASAATARTNLGLGTAATKTAGTLAGQVLLLATDNKLPALDGSALTGISTGKLIASYTADYTANVDLTTALPIDDTVPTNTEGTQILSVSVTTTSATQVVRLSFAGSAIISAGGASGVALFRDGACIRTDFSTGSAVSVRFAIDFTDTPGAAGTYVYTIRAGGTSGAAMRFNGSATARVGGGKNGVSLNAIVMEP